MSNKPLTIKQAKFVKAYVANDGNGQEAAKAAYDVKSDAVARTVASETLTLPNVKAALQKALDKHGITIEKATKPIADGLTAETEFYDKNGDLMSKPDHTTRLKASGMALKLMGAEQKEDRQGNTVNFINSATFKSNKYVD